AEALSSLSTTPAPRPPQVFSRRHSAAAVSLLPMESVIPALVSPPSMNPTNAPTPAPYDGLSVRTTDVFPLTCVRCQRRFTEINDFVARTTPIFHSSGLMEREDPATGTFVLLLRNCLCGTSLALRCKDRRD